jgi:hypothetical protein
VAGAGDGLGSRCCLCNLGHLLSLAVHELHVFLIYSARRVTHLSLVTLLLPSLVSCLPCSMCAPLGCAVCWSSRAVYTTRWLPTTL